MSWWLCILLFPAYALALTAPEVRDSVLANFQLIDEAKLKVAAADSEVTAARGEFDFKLYGETRNRIEDKYDNQYFEGSIRRRTSLGGLELIAGHRQGTGTFPPYDGKYDTSTAGELFAGLGLPLLRNFSTDEARTNLEVAKIEKAQSEEQLNLKKNIYVHKALSLYHAWQFEVRNLAIRKQVLTLAEGRQKMLETRYKSGDIERVKLTDNQRSINKRRDEVLKAEMKLTDIETQLGLYLPGKNPDDFARGRNVIPLKIDTQLALGNGTTSKTTEIPQIKILELEYKKLLRLQELYDQGRLPGLQLNLLAAKELSRDEPYDPQSLQVGLKFDLPLENRKAEGTSTAQAYKVKAILKQKEFVQNQINRGLEFSLQALKISTTRWETVSQEAEATHAMATAERRRWEQGSSDIFFVNLREEDIGDAEARRWATYNEYQQLLLDTQLYSGTITGLAL